MISTCVRRISKRDGCGSGVAHGGSGLRVRIERLFEGGENADISLAVTLVFGSRAVFAEERFDALGEASRLLTVDVNDERRALWVAVVDDGESYRLVATDTPNIGRSTLMNIYKNEDRRTWYLDAEVSDGRVDQVLANDTD
jgi:hypothetical protein